ncbi:hypothetical protein B1H10_00875 [candidate division KSB1 bacterium 4484_188]|nr:MAG: hypothetical protein B1H10_00875 [candidate division KSB1 bacterium 4484_188]
MYRFLLVFSLVFLVAGMGVLSAQTYVGPEKCLQCHNNPALGDATGWRSSLHANGYSYVPDDANSLVDKLGIVADYDQNGIDDFKDGLDFNTINSAFDQYKPNAPILGYSPSTGYTVTIGQVTHKVYLTYGGSGYWKQRYMVRINTSQGESAALYISPVQYNDVTHAYAAYHPEKWWDASNQPIYTPSSTLADAANSKSMPQGCSGCHMTGLELSQDSNGEWIASAAPVENEALYSSYNNIWDVDGDGDLDQINTGCESCHGPGSTHAASPSAANIINPDSLTSEQANNLCGFCHNRGKSLPNNTFGFPFDDQNLTGWMVGELVANYFTDGGGDWPDGKHSVKHRQQYLDFIESSKPTFQFHQVRCSECHDVHNTLKHHIREEIEEEDSLGNPLVIQTENDNNTLCLACHATHGDFTDIPKEWVADYNNHINDIAAVVTQHTHHPYDPEGNGASRCSKCHNPKVAKSAIAYDIHSHTFEPIAPEKTVVYQNSGNGMPNACAVSCHVKSNYPNFGIDFSNDNFAVWNEATDLALADTLMHYYGPNGVWWQFTGIEQTSVQVPATLSLSQNFPNPFNPETNIVFEIPTRSEVNLSVYNVLGQKVAELYKGTTAPGSYKVTFDGSGFSSGFYIYSLQTGNRIVTKKMLLMK